MSEVFFNGTVVRNNIIYLVFDTIAAKVEVPVDKNTADRIMKMIATIIPPIPKTIERGNDESSE